MAKEKDNQEEAIEEEVKTNNYGVPVGVQLSHEEIIKMNRQREEKLKKAKK